MKIEWTVTHTAELDIERAEDDYYDELSLQDDPTNEDVVWDCISEALNNNIVSDVDIDDLPAEVWDKCADALKKRIGGIQIRIEDLPSFPTLWQEDSVWKK